MGRVPRIGAFAAALPLQAAPIAWARDNIALGRTAFNSNCAVCHMATKTGHALIGPNLFGIVGRPAASVAGFAYSPAMQHSRITWTTDRIAAYRGAGAGSARHEDVLCGHS